jgi:2-iminobutanoate/2-iminopropanoate deaminase
MNPCYNHSAPIEPQGITPIDIPDRYSYFVDGKENVVGKRIISTDKAPQMIGAYSQAIASDKLRMVFCSGQIAIDPESNNMIPGGIREQTERVIRNVEAVLNAAGSDMSRVLKVTVFLKSMDDFPDFNEVYAGFFGSSPPARATVEVSGLPKSALIEMDAIAEI